MRIPRKRQRTRHPSERGSLQNRLLRAVLGLFAAPRVNMRDDYDKIRRQQRKLAASLGPPFGATDHQMTSDDGSHQIRVRSFRPKEQLRNDVLLFFHGGGWVTGDVDTYSPTCVTMAEKTGCVVISVDYRLAPEHPFPAGFQDCYAVARQLLQEPRRVGIDDADNIVLIGDSAGGNLAAAVSVLLAERGYRGASRQILLYPLTHWDHHPETSPFDSVREHGQDYRLTNTEVRDYFDLYLSDPQQRHEQLVSPLLATDLSGQPRTLIITAELDLLRDEGEAYGRALEQAGNAVQIHRVDGALHGFIALPRFSRASREAYEMINTFLDDDSVAGQQFRPKGRL